MSAGALVLVLCAAVMHASWNALVAGARDSRATTAVAAVLSVVLFAPAAVLTGGVGTRALPYVAGSAALHLIYFALLAAAYGGGELAVVYPVARGSAPVLVLVVGVLALGAGASAPQVAGVVMVAVGVLLVRRSGRAAAPDVGFGLAVGACIAAYTLVDNAGMTYARPLAYLELLLIVPAFVYAAGLWATGMGPALRSAVRPSTLVVAVFVFGAYALVLAALRIAPAAPVAAVRESSVVFGTLMAAVFLGEEVGARRIVGSSLVFAGVVAVALG